MKISDLPPGLKELAERRKSEYPLISQSKDVTFAIRWNKTPEGKHFWLKISVGNFTPFYNCKIVNCKPKMK
jgi:hypothetical protein